MNCSELYDSEWRNFVKKCCKLAKKFSKCKGLNINVKVIFERIRYEVTSIRGMKNSSKNEMKIAD